MWLVTLTLVLSCAACCCYWSSLCQWYTPCDTVPPPTQMPCQQTVCTAWVLDVTPGTHSRILPIIIKNEYCMMVYTYICFPTGLLMPSCMLTNIFVTLDQMGKFPAFYLLTELLHWVLRYFAILIYEWVLLKMLKPKDNSQVGVRIYLVVTCRKRAILVYSVCISVFINFSFKAVDAPNPHHLCIQSIPGIFELAYLWKTVLFCVQAFYLFLY